MYSRINTIYKRNSENDSATRSETTQTDHLNKLDLLKLLLFCENLVINEESKNIYNLILNYINKFHNLLNEKLTNHLEKNVKTFKIPEVPCYMLLCDIANKRHCVNGKDHSENVSEEAKIWETQIHNSKAQNSSSRKTLIRHGILEKSTESHSCKENVQRSNIHVHGNDLTEKDKEIISSGELTKNDNINGSYATVGSKCEKRGIILSRYLDEVDIKTNCHLTEQPNTILQHLDEKLSGNGPKDSGDHRNAQLKRQRLVTSNFNIINIEPKFEMSSNTTKIISEENTETNIKENDYIKQHSISSDDICSNSVQSSTCLSDILNEKHIPKIRPHTPSKVLEMFEKISPQNLLAKNLTVFKHFSQKSNSIETANSIKDITLTDSDSDILDDENFEILSSQSRYQKKSSSVIVIDSKEGNITGYSEAKSHPLQLTGKDLNNLSQETINAIGLFTDSGDIKPAVRNILEQQRQNRSGNKRNQLFRNTRQLNTKQ